MSLSPAEQSHFSDVYRVALAADVEKAFLVVSICEENRDVFRFLWVDNINKATPVSVVMQFTRVVIGVFASPFLFNATINHHLEKYHNNHPELVNTLSKSIYVDDVTYDADGEDEAYQLYVLSNKLFEKGGYNLRNFVTSSVCLCQRIVADEQKLEQNQPMYFTY